MRKIVSVKEICIFGVLQTIQGLGGFCLECIVCCVSGWDESPEMQYLQLLLKPSRLFLHKAWLSSLEQCLYSEHTGGQCKRI